MKESVSGEAPPASSGAHAGIRTSIVRIEHAVVTKARPGTAWQIFTNCEYWRRISDRYRGIEWYGTPWTPGSRVRVKLLHPVVATVDRVITACEPGQSIAWINHLIGYTMEQWLFFQPVAGGGARIFTWLEFVGPSDTIEGRPVQAVIEEYLQEWYECFRIECDRVALSS